MAKLWTLGTFWWITVLAWLLSPILTLLVNKLFAYLADLIFDASRKLRELEIHTVSELKRTLQVVEEKRILRTVKDVECQFDDLKTLDKMNKDLKSALYEAEDILDLIGYCRIEKNLGISWLKEIFHVACECISRCKFRRWIKFTQAVLVKCAQRFYRLLGQVIVHLNQEPGKLFRCVTLRRSGALLPLFGIPSISATGAANPPLRPEEVREAVEIEEEEKDNVEEIEEEKEEREDNVEEIEEEKEEQREVVEIQEAVEWEGWSRWEGKLRCHRILHFVGSTIVWLINALATVRYYRDWSCEQILGENIQMDYSFLFIILQFNLRKRIEHIEYILDDSKKSPLLNQQSSSSSAIPEESRRRQDEITNLHRRIDQKVFGRDEERERICSMLRKGSDADGPTSSSNKPYSVFGIHGITGSGKTTLAKYVCDLEKNAKDKHFYPVMFIHVSETFRLDKIFRDMLSEIRKSQQSDSNDITALHNELKKNLEGKRFLLVLDDLWVNDENQKERDVLLDTLNVGQCGSRILVTAQREDAAAALGAQEQSPITDLEEEQYFLMFIHYAVEGTNSDHDRYISIGKKIAKKLRRSPIAAVTVARRLHMSKSISFWERTANDDVLNKTMGALWWSYQHLGADIKRCFAYCSTFPRGYGLKRDELVRIWIAQGFVSPSSHATEEWEDLGNRYIDELLTFSFLQVQGTNFVTELTIHDLLHELAERVAGSDFHRIDWNGPPKDILAGVRHVFIKTNNVTKVLVEKNLDLRNLRTLIIKEHCTENTDRKLPVDDLEKVFDCLFKRLRELRVLIVELQHETKVLSVPASIDRMKHLRYLGFHFSSYAELILPSTFSKLYQMQTIDVNRGSPYTTVYCPEDTANLLHLRHITGWLPFPNVGRLTSLQTLPCFGVKEEQGYELKQVKHLNKLRGALRIRGLGIVRSKEEALEAQLVRKERVTKLLLDFGHNTCNPDMTAEVLEGLCPPKDLVELVIWRYQGSRYPSWMLSRQHPDAPKHLQELRLYRCIRLASIPEDCELFSHLRELHLHVCDWDSLPENMERLVSLQKLFIFDCDKMELLPTLPQSLRVVEISYCDVLSTTCKEEGHENWHKIQHVRDKFVF